MLFWVHVTYKHHTDIKVNVCFVSRRFAPFEVLSTVTHTHTLTPGGEKHRQRKRSMIFFGGTREQLRAIVDQMNTGTVSKTTLRETFERRGGAHNYVVFCFVLFCFLPRVYILP